ncbi:MAG: hypothetical protein OEY14_04000 [Myxococcales bacterium]|nr:hypothetical protein [Myxococcales bacterium]
MRHRHPSFSIGRALGGLLRLLLLAPLACGPSASPASSPPASSPAASSPAASSQSPETLGSTAAAEPEPPPPYAELPLTPFARESTRALWAQLPSELAARLRPDTFLLRLELELLAGAAEEAPSACMLTLALDAEGLSLAQLERRDARCRACASLPIPEISRERLRGALTPWLAALRLERSPPRASERIEGLPALPIELSALRSGELAELRIDALGVLARDPEGRRVLVELDASGTIRRTPLEGGAPPASASPGL